MSARPPRLARWLLHRVLPDDMRDEVIGDLDEIFARRHASEGRARTVAWYCLQILLFPLHLFVERWQQGKARLGLGVGMSWIDFKLAVRMFVRYPGLSAVAVLGMTVGIAIASAAFAIGYRLLNPTLPFEDGDRIVAISNWDLNRRDSEPRALHDFLHWRAAITTVEGLGASRSVGLTLVAPGVQPEPITVAEISASAFTVVRMPPLLGRHLTPADEQSGAPDVVILREDVWRRRFAGDPNILGRQVQLGGTSFTVVGIMPKDFAFPVNHGVWIPLRLPPSAEPLTGPPLVVFGRLASGVGIEAAQSELDTIGARATAASPKTHEHLRPRIEPYAQTLGFLHDPDNALALRAIQTLILLVLILVCSNVAILVYARTASRQGEIAVRTALGASRRRIVTQLFLEALVPAAVAAAVGTMLVAEGLRQLDASIRLVAGNLPFWFSMWLSPEGVAAIVGSTLLAAAIVGIAPALKATGPRVQARLQGLSAGSGSRMQMGRLWTFLIVAQVAVAVAVLPAIVYHTWDALRFRTGDLGFAAGEFLTGELLMNRSRGFVTSDEDEKAYRIRYGAQLAALEAAVERDASVAAMTFSLVGPGGELAAVLDAEGVPAPIDPVDYNIVSGSRRGRLVRFNRVAPDFFEAYGVPLLAGRGLTTADAGARATGVLVNRAFASTFYGSENPLGRRIRYVGRSREAGEGHVELERWYEIVGVVSDFPAPAMRGNGHDARVYHALAPGDVQPAVMAIRVRATDPATFAPRLRTVAAGVDPAFQIRDLATAADVLRREQGMMRLIGWSLAIVMLSVVALAAAGIYALTAFTVERRRKEIGIRAALGADARQILVGVFSRLLAQLGTGAVIGLIAAAGLETILEGDAAFQGKMLLFPVVAICTVAFGLLAAIGPARRGLRIQPIEALREE